MSPVNIALLGAGIFIKEEYLPALLSLANHFVLKAVYSRSKKSADSVLEIVGKDKGIDLYSDDSHQGLDELLSRTDIQAVIIALPILAQTEIIQKSLQKGKHVLAEKPIAPTVAEGEELLKFSSNLKQLFCVAENYRFIPRLVFAREQVGRLGKFQTFNFVRQTYIHQDNQYYNTLWRKNPGYQGGFLLDGGVHHAATIRFITRQDDIDGLLGITSLSRDHLPPVDSLDGIVKFKDGTSGTLSLRVGSKGRTNNETTIVAEKGYVIVTEDSVVTCIDGQQEHRTFNGLETGVKQELEAFACSIVTGKKDDRLSPEKALLDLRMIEGFLNSGEKNGAYQKFW